MLHRLLASLMLLFFVFSASLLFAQNNSERPSETPPIFNDLDKNGDGRLSRDELSNPALFERMDANINGWVTLAEAQRWAQRRAMRESGVEVSQNSDDSNDGTVVYPPDPEAESTRRRLLEQVNDVTTGEKRPPNIVLILADDLGYADTGVYGSTSIPTPHIDSLAAEGTRFTNAYVTAASCSPSRAGLMTGCYQQRFGFKFNTSSGLITYQQYRGLDPTAVTLAEVLNKAGYVTGIFGKWHLGARPHFHPHSRGFDEFYGFLAGAHSFFPVLNEEPVYSTIMRGRDAISEPEYLTDAIARETVRFINKHHDQPFFAYVPFNAVHTPIQATPVYQERFPDVSDPKRRDYYAMTSALDDAVGKIIDVIDRQGITRDTLIIFLNDNGGPIYTGVQSNGPLRLGKLFLFEGGVRVPMIIKWPGSVPPTTIFDGTVSSLDVFPTVCSAANIDLRKVVDFDGVDLLPFLSGDANGNPHQTLFWSNGPNVAVRSGDWKLIKSYNNAWLSNLAEDLGEENNLATDRPEIVERLESELEGWKSEMHEPAWPSKPQRSKTPIDGMIYEMNI